MLFAIAEDLPLLGMATFMYFEIGQLVSNPKLPSPAVPQARNQRQLRGVRLSNRYQRMLQSAGQSGPGPVNGWAHRNRRVRPGEKIWTR